MKRNSTFAALAFGVGVLAWSLAGQVLQSGAAEKQPTVNPGLAQLHIRLLGVSQ